MSVAVAKAKSDLSGPYEWEDLLNGCQAVAQGVRLSRTPFEVRSAAPDQGVHTDEVLGEYRYSTAEIADFRKRGIV